MTSYCMTLLEQHRSQLQELTMPDCGNEGIAILLLSRCDIDVDPWTTRRRCKLISHAVLPVSPEHVESCSPTHITYSNRFVIPALKRAGEENLIVAVVHSHRQQVPEFSVRDDTAEAGVHELCRHRNGHDTELVSIIMLPDGEVSARVWVGDGTPHEISSIRILGDTWRFQGQAAFPTLVSDAQRRQVLAFGPEFSQLMAGLRFGVVGCGATGTATAEFLIQHGAQFIAVFDRDIVERSNVSRMHGARIQDADDRALKVDIVHRMADETGLGTQVIRFPHWVDQPECQDALKSLDVVFCCSDDHSGRLFLNRFAYFYATPTIDMGVVIDPAVDRPGQLLAAEGRVTVLLPGTRCFLCRGVIDPLVARDETLYRQNPTEYSRRQGHGYVRRFDIPNPAVGWQTTAVATMAFEELVHRLTGFRHRGHADHRVRKFLLMEDKFPGVKSSGTCRICERQDYWGRGDMRPFLDRAG